jgi:pilus assembly protein CpaE
MILVIDPNRDVAVRVATALAGEGEVRRIETREQVQAAHGELGVALELAVVGPTFPLEEAAAVATTLRDLDPAISVILLSPEVSADVFRVAVRSGISEVLPQDCSDHEMLDAASRGIAMTRRLRPVDGAGGADASGRDRQTVSVFSTKGGSGKSLIATNVAVLLAREAPGEVVLVDLNLQSGDLAVMLQLVPAWTIHDAAVKGDTLDEDELRGYLTAHDSGLRVLAGPAHPSEAEDVDGLATTRILQLLGKMFRYVVIDGASSFTEPMLAALDASDAVVLVASMDVPSIKNLRTALQTLEELGFDREQLKLVLNRADSRVGLTLREIERSLGGRIDVAIPSSREVPFSVNQGSPLALDKPKSAVVKAIADLLTMFRTPSADEPAGGLFRRGR